jgi:protein-S-isoprenylcysteine O-methyltransferase Ste14
MSARPLRIRPSTTRSTVALWSKSLLNAALFFGIFMVLLPWGAHRLLPVTLPFPACLRSWGGGALFVAGVSAWLHCLDAFSRHGRGTPLPFDAPRHLVTSGLYGVLRNPIMAAELVVIWAEAIYFASLGVLVYASAISLTAHLMVVYVEEPELHERFGASYDAYCRRVPRWLPRLGRRDDVA